MGRNLKVCSASANHGPYHKFNQDPRQLKLGQTIDITEFLERQRSEQHRKQLKLNHHGTGTQLSKTEKHLFWSHVRHAVKFDKIMRSYDILGCFAHLHVSCFRAIRHSHKELRKNFENALQLCQQTVWSMSIIHFRFTRCKGRGGTWSVHSMELRVLPVRPVLPSKHLEAYVPWPKRSCVHCKTFSCPANLHAWWAENIKKTFSPAGPSQLIFKRLCD